MFHQLNVLLKIILLHTVCDTVSVARPDTAQEADSNALTVPRTVLNVTLIRLLMSWQI